MKKICLIVLQVLAFMALYYVGAVISYSLNIPVPGGLIGMAILLVLLGGGYVKLEWFEDGAAFLISNLLLFFVPSAIGIIQYNYLFGSVGILLLAVVITSIVAVLASIMGTTMWAMKLKRKGYRLWQ